MIGGGVLLWQPVQQFLSFECLHIVLGNCDSMVYWQPTPPPLPNGFHARIGELGLECDAGVLQAIDFWRSQHPLPRPYRISQFRASWLPWQPRIWHRCWFWPVKGIWGTIFSVCTYPFIVLGLGGSLLYHSRSWRSADDGYKEEGIFVVSTQLWNSLPREAHMAPSLVIFRQWVKMQLDGWTFIYSWQVFFNL